MSTNRHPEAGRFCILHLETTFKPVPGALSVNYFFPIPRGASSEIRTLCAAACYCFLHVDRWRERYVGFPRRLTRLILKKEVHTGTSPANEPPDRVIASFTEGMIVLCQSGDSQKFGH